ncbi:MAG TPA: hypothetical protein VK464_20430, partial [Symbiobacteriaceae bacterium]|nr:hypothetical protein [Symbiobacteriaceae bacterium]
MAGNVVQGAGTSQAPKASRTRVDANMDLVPKQIVIPKDFEGIVQINVQAQQETESLMNTQNQATNVAVTQMQNQVAQVIGTLQTMQGMMAQMAMGQQATQSQMQMLMVLLGTTPGTTEEA